MSMQYILHTIDGDLETFSDGEPKTKSCPLLPGQTMNVLDVPLQANLVAGRNVSSTSIDSLVFTLDPKDKYLPPDVRRAATTSAIKQRKARMSAVPKVLHRAASTPLQSEAPPKTSTSSRAGPPTLKRQRSLRSVFQRMRQTKSAGSNPKSSLAWPRKIFSRTGQLAKIEAAEDIPEVPKLPTLIPGGPAIAKDVELELPMRLPLAHGSGRAAQAATEVEEELVIVPWPQESTSLGEYQPDFPCGQDSHCDGKPRSVGGKSKTSFESSRSTPLEHLMAHNSYFAEFSAVVGDGVLPSMQEHAERLSSLKHSAGQLVPIKLPTDQQASIGRSTHELRRAEEPGQVEERSYATTYACSGSSSFSYVHSEDQSPGWASNTTSSGPMSPLHLSQPETPIMSEFEDDYDSDCLQLQRFSKSFAELASEDSNISDATVLPPPSRAPPPPPPQTRPMTPRSAFPGFQGYSLPQDDYKSVLTIRKLPSTTFPTADARPSFSRQSGKQHLVHSWNDGSEKLLDDLGYLGEVIL